MTLLQPIGLAGIRRAGSHKPSRLRAALFFLFAAFRRPVRRYVRRHRWVLFLLSICSWSPCWNFPHRLPNGLMGPAPFVTLFLGSFLDRAPQPLPSIEK